jgi:hypothetical protein
MNKDSLTFKINYLFLITGTLMTISEIWKQWYLTFRLNNGIYQWWFFPFQLCSIAMYVLIALFWVKKQTLRTALLTFLMCFSLLGGIAVFADTSGLHYPTLCLTLHSFIWHITLIIVGLTAGAECIREHKNKIFTHRDFWNSTLIYLICCIIAAFMNYFFDTFGDINMFYINPDYIMSQIGFYSLVKYWGNNVVILLYILATICGAFILFCIWNFIAGRCQKYWINSGKS